MKKILLFGILFVSALTFGQVTFLTTDTTWSGDITMDGKVVVNAGVTLTIQPGTVIKGIFKNDPTDATALIVAKDGNIIANGTASLPIIFTSEFDLLTASDVASGTYVAAGFDITQGGLWGGVIILGNNVIGSGPTNTANIEGIAAGQTFTNYGGTATDDNSGSLKYISIRHGGATIANGSEINGLTLGGVGNKTIIENIEVISNTDDGIELFGGNVNVNNVLVFNQTDDAIDIDQAYSGTITNVLVAFGDTIGDNVFEIDGTESTSNPPITGSYTIDGVTAIGSPNAGQLDTYGDWKSNPIGENKNIVYKGFKTGSRIEFIDADTYNDGTLKFSNIDFVTSGTLASTNSTKADTAFLTSAQAEVLSAQAAGTGAVENVFYDWTAYFASGTGTLSVEDVITNEFSIYPNPFNNILTVSNQVKVDTLKLFNIAGQLVKQNKNSNSINVAELSKGIYFLEVTSESSRNVKKVIKN